jgi:hypothetical protein
MKSSERGMNASTVELTRVADDGVAIRVDGRELFLRFDQFPWFRYASTEQIACIERLGTEHLRWPRLEVDLTIESIEHPERYPLVSRAGPNRPR